jgi:hypothetical protein
MVGMSANRWSGRFALEKFPAIHSRHQGNQNDELGVGSSVNASMLSVTWRYDLTPFLSQKFYRITGFAFVTLCRNTNSMSLNSRAFARPATGYSPDCSSAAPLGWPETLLPAVRPQVGSRLVNCLRLQPYPQLCYPALLALMNYR